MGFEMSELEEMSHGTHRSVEEEKYIAETLERIKVLNEQFGYGILVFPPAVFLELAGVVEGEVSKVLDTGSSSQ